DDVQRSHAAWTAAITSGEDFEIEVRNRRHDGEYRWFVTRATAVRDEQGAIQGWFGSTIDVHDRKLASQALQEADRRKDEFLAILAHELRNPLSPIRNAAHYLKLRRPTDAELRRPLEMIERQVAQMARLIDDLLDVSRITRGTFELRRERVTCGEIVDAAVEACRD